VSRSCFPSPCCSTGNVGGLVGVYPASLWRYPALPLSFHARRDIVAVFGFAVAVSFFALISSHPAWYRCSIRLRCGGILLRPYLFTPLSLHARYGIIAVFGVAVAVSFFALISYLFLQVVVTAPGHGDRERGLWREIIYDFDLLRFTLQVICAPPCRTTPMRLPSF